MLKAPQPFLMEHYRQGKHSVPRSEGRAPLVYIEMARPPTALFWRGHNRGHFGPRD